MKYCTLPHPCPRRKHDLINNLSAGKASIIESCRLSTVKIVAKVAQLLRKKTVSDLRRFNAQIASLYRVDIARHRLAEL